MNNKRIAGSTGCHAVHKGKVASTGYPPVFKKRKFEASKTSDDESVGSSNANDAPDAILLDAGPSKKRRLELDRLTTQENAKRDFSCPKATTKQVPKETMSIVERKRFFVITPTEQMETSMRAYVSITDAPFLHQQSRDCWLHPSPPQASRHTGRLPGAISCHFSWKDTTDTYHSIGVNYGVVALLVKHRLTWTQRVGFIYNSWHLSHLCGNWTCCNWRHFTVEPGPINIGRNACLLSSGLRTRKSDGKCKHQPPCMRKRKIKGLKNFLTATTDYQVNPVIPTLIQTSPSSIHGTSAMVELRKWAEKVKNISREAFRTQKL